MPKVIKPPRKNAPPAASSTEAGPSTSKSQVAVSKPSQKLYSGFLPIPISLPSPLPLPVSSTSKKTTLTVTHYLYVRAHKGKPSLTLSQDQENTDQGGRTAFVVNLPVDLGDRDLRSLFSKWGVIENVEISGVETDVLEQAVKGLPIDVESEEDDEDEEEDGDDEDEEKNPSKNFAESAQFLGNGEKLSRQARRRKKNAIPRTVPEIIPLPPTNPRSTPYGLSGLRTAHITWIDSISLTRLLQYSGSPISVTPSEPSGLSYYLTQHLSCRPNLVSVKDFSDSSMARYDHLHGLLLSSRARSSGAGALVDEDGFTVVIRGGKYGRTGGRGDGVGGLGVGVAKRGFEKDLAEKRKKKKNKGAEELMDFYRFQKMDRKKQELADLRSKFEEDKKKVEEMKKSRRFKPY